MGMFWFVIGIFLLAISVTVSMALRDLAKSQGRRVESKIRVENTAYNEKE